MVFLGGFHEITPDKSAEELWSEEIKQFINRIVKKPSSGFDPTAYRKHRKVSRWQCTKPILMHVYFIQLVVFSNTSNESTTENSVQEILKEQLSYSVNACCL